MSAQEIIEVSKKYRLLPEHLHGQTMHKTLQARLSEDIIDNRFRSQFYRVSSGIFFLREFIDDLNTNDEYKKEFHAPRRQAAPRQQRVLCVPRKYIKIGRGYYFNDCEAAELFRSNHATYLRKNEAEIDDDTVQAMTFTIVLDRKNVLMHRVGKFSEFFNFSEGRTIGFRSNVGEFDIDLLNDDMIGVKRNASRVIFRNIIFCKDAITDVEVIDLLTTSGIFYDGRKNLAFVVMFIAEEDNITLRTRRSLGLSEVRWCSLEKVHTHDVDEWSKEIAKGITRRVYQDDI